jgi:hypothetical protein
MRGKMQNSGNEAKKLLKTKEVRFDEVRKRTENEPKMELLLGAKRILHHRDTEAQRSEQNGSFFVPQWF